EGSFGHTGFTGTSLWIDPKEELIVTFLTNIVHYGRHHNMKQIRPHLHSLISTTLTKGETF
ncbi:serine hydrolase, partial [Bacillus sp. NTK074B]|nr:serine hydrolase [Bacillus sp. NTK074B]